MHCTRIFLDRVFSLEKQRQWLKRKDSNLSLQYYPKSVHLDFNLLYYGWTHGACGAVCAPDEARLCHAAGPVLVHLNVSSCRDPENHHPAYYSSQRRTDWPAPEKDEKEENFELFFLPLIKKDFSWTFLLMDEGEMGEN